MTCYVCSIHWANVFVDPTGLTLRHPLVLGLSIASENDLVVVLEPRMLPSSPLQGYPSGVGVLVVDEHDQTQCLVQEPCILARMGACRLES